MKRLAVIPLTGAQRGLLEAGVQFWRACLEAPQLMRNGDAHQSLVMTSLAEMNFRAQSQEKLDLFSRELLGRYLKQVAALGPHQKFWESDDYTLSLSGVDYDPDDSLRQACERAGLRWAGSFPMKHRMALSFDRVEVRIGYGGRARRILAQLPGAPPRPEYVAAVSCQAYPCLAQVDFLALPTPAPGQWPNADERALPEGWSEQLQPYRYQLCPLHGAWRPEVRL